MHDLFSEIVPTVGEIFPNCMCAVPALTPAARTARAAPAFFGLQTLFDLLRPRDNPAIDSSSMSGLVRQCGAPCGSGFCDKPEGHQKREAGNGCSTGARKHMSGTGKAKQSAAASEHAFKPGNQLGCGR